jgi:hypothetical protein
METFSRLFDSLLTFAYHCFDHIVINGYVSGLFRLQQADVLECPNCFGRTRIVYAIHPPDTIRKILDCLGLPSRPPPIAAAFPGEPDFE